MKPVLKLALFTCLLAACSNQKSSVPSSDLTSQLTGEWRNVYMKVTMNTYRNSDTARIMEVDESNWEEKLKSRTIQTFFRNDGTYNSVHRNLKDSIFYNPAGYWKIVGDSLHMTDTFPERGLQYIYHLEISGNIATFRGIEDFDQDGKKDDTYFGTQRKQ